MTTKETRRADGSYEKTTKPGPGEWAWAIAGIAVVISILFGK